MRLPQGLRSFFMETGEIAQFAGRFFREMWVPPFEFREFLRQCYEVGNKSMQLVLLTGFINLFVGSASAKWALLAPIFVPMLMELGISPDLTQAAYRVGDSTSNIITPLMPYFPLVVVYCQRYVKGTGIGTLTAMMLPYSITFLISWTIFLLVYYAIGLPLGIQASYTYP